MIGNIYAYDNGGLYFLCISDKMRLTISASFVCGFGLYDLGDFNHSWWIKT